MEDMQTKKMKGLFADKELSTEQLEEVVGGSFYEMADDSRFLNVLLRGRPGQCDRYGVDKCRVVYTRFDVNKEITDAWASVGVTAYLDGLGNKYYINGKKVTRDQAWAHAQKVVGKTLQKSDWYWEK